MFLKKAYGVGYQLTIEKQSATKMRSSVARSLVATSISNGKSIGDEDGAFTEASLAVPSFHEYSEVESDGIETGILASSVSRSSVTALTPMDDQLKDIVLGNVDNARLLSNVGTEMSFQLPLGAASSFGPMFKGLDKEVDAGKIATYGVSITTLDEVFLMVARGDSGEESALASSRMSTAPVKSNEDKSARSRMNLEKTGLFSKHVRALFEKRALNFKRDKKVLT